MSEVKTCMSCKWYNGIQGDGEQFCDELEIYVHDSDCACNRYRYEDKKEWENQ